MTRLYLAVFIYLAGLVVGILLAVLAIWADLEASFYFNPAVLDDPLKTLRCPVLMTRSETAEVSARFTNQTDREISILVRTNISNPGLFRSEEIRLPLAIGQTETLRYTLTEDDADMKNFVLVHMIQLPTYRTRGQEGVCGAMLVDFPWLTGTQLFFIGLVFSASAMGTGWYFWVKSPRRREQIRGMGAALLFLAITILAAVLTSAFGSWGLAGPMLVVAILLIGVLLFMVLTE